MAGSQWFRFQKLLEFWLEYRARRTKRVRRRTSRLSLEFLEDRLAPAASLVADINLTAAGSSPADFTEVNGVIFFTATDATHGLELWKTTGTGGSTALVKDIRIGSRGSSLSNLTSVNGM